MKFILNGWLIRYDFPTARVQYISCKRLNQGMVFTLLYDEIHAKRGYESLVQNGRLMDEFLTFRGYVFHSVIYWNSCLTGVWILGTKWAFNGWISWPFHTLMVQYISCKWMNYSMNFQLQGYNICHIGGWLRYEFPTIRVQYTSHKWINWEWFSNHRGTKKPT